jgi:tripartite-type tricarboxylate transporter receptor subunit TctC
MEGRREIRAIRIAAWVLNRSAAQASRDVGSDMVRLIATLASIALLAWCPGAYSAEYPERPVRFVVPFAAGGTATINARAVANQLAQEIGQNVVIDNRPGANGIIGIQIVSNAAPDGYTMLYTTTSIAINQSVYKNLPYDLFRDLVPVTIVALGEGYVLLATPSFPARTLGELIERAQRQRVTFGSAGIGNSTHLVAERFAKAAGVKLEHVPYKGVAPAMSAVIAGEVNIMFIPPTAAVGQIKAGRVRVLGFTGKSRWSQLPDVPTLDEAGVRGFHSDSGFNALFAPAQTPRSILARMQQAIRKALQAPRVKEVFVNGAYKPLGNTPEEALDFLREQVKEFGDIVRELGIQQN